MARIFRIGSVVLVSVGALAAVLSVSSTAVARSSRRTAVVAGYVQLCGGPAPGRCWKGGIGFCDPSQGCVTSDRVAAVNSSGRRVATQSLHHGRFRLRLCPGHYTIELLGDGKRVHGKVMQRKSAWARAGRTTHVRFFFAVP